ncbi:MAG: DUF4271 domain-containing protein [Ekhidna sp.]|nr:DUF4271 domain-containing protein [Ekhidna sp.]
MKLTTIIAFVILSNSSFSQVDTVVIADLKEVMVSVNSRGIAVPVSTVRAKTTDFFLEKSYEGALKICSQSTIYFWLDGRLTDTFSSCKFFEIKDLSEKSASERLHISLHSERGIENVTCEHVVFKSSPDVKEDYRKLRESRKVVDEFLIISILLISLFFGWTMTTNPSRIDYVFKKSFSLKLGSYEFVSTSFLNKSNFQLLLLLSFILGLLSLSGALLNNKEAGLESMGGIILAWIKGSLFVLLLLCVKWTITSLISLLFGFKKLNEFHFFDFQNFLLLASSLITFIYFIGFTICPPLQMFVQNGAEIIILLLFTAYLAWFSIKFIKNSSESKLQIITYLCTVELLPTALFYIEVLK